MMANRLDGLWAALSFLTRLGPPRIVAAEVFPRTLPWFPVVGLLVGALAVLPCSLGLFGAYPALQGWFMVGVSLWLTRGLHADGLADIADAWGSGASGDRFWTILKDSRAGPFAVVGLVMVLAGQGLAFGLLAGQGRYGVICWCFALGRLAALGALAANRDRARPGLSALFAPGASWGVFAVALGVTALAGLALCPASSVLAGLVLAAPVVLALTRLCARKKGFNGDFIGAAVVLGELAGALGALL